MARWDWISLKIDEKQADNLLLSMAMLSLKGRTKRLFLQRMGKYTADHARKLQKEQRTNTGHPIKQKSRHTDWDGHEWGGKAGFYFDRETKKPKKLFENLFRAKNLKISKPDNDSVRLAFRRGKDSKKHKGEPQASGHIGGVAHLHHYGRWYKMWVTLWPQGAIQWQKISDLYKISKGRRLKALEERIGKKHITVQQAMFLARSGIIKDKTPRQIFYETSQEMFADKMLRAKLLDILPKKEKVSDKMTARPILGLNDDNITTLSDFVLRHLSDSFKNRKLPNPPKLMP